MVINHLSIRVIHFESKCEYWALFRNRLERYVAPKSLHNLFRDCQTKSNAVSVHLFDVLNISEKLEQLVLIFIGNSHSCIFYRNFKKIVSDVNIDLNLTFFSEFKGVWKQTQKHLHDPILICINHGTMLKATLKIRDGVIGCEKLNAVFLSNVFEHSHYCWNCVFYVEFFQVLLELSWFYLREIQKIFDHKSHYICRGFLYF